MPLTALKDGWSPKIIYYSVTGHSMTRKSCPCSEYTMVINLFGSVSDPFHSYTDPDPNKIEKITSLKKKITKK